MVDLHHVVVLQAIAPHLVEEFTLAEGDSRALCQRPQQAASRSVELDPLAVDLDDRPAEHHGVPPEAEVPNPS